MISAVVAGLFLFLVRIGALLSFIFLIVFLGRTSISSFLNSVVGV